MFVTTMYWKMRPTLQNKTDLSLLSTLVLVSYRWAGREHLRRTAVVGEQALADRVVTSFLRHNHHVVISHNA